MTTSQTSPWILPILPSLPSSRPIRAPHREELSVSRFAFTYAIIAILLFFSMQGFLPSTSAGAGDDDAQSAVGQSFQGGMWLIGLLLMVPYTGPILRTCWQMKSLTLLALLAPVSALWSQNPATSLRRGIFLILATLFAFYLVRRFTARELAQVVILAGVCAGLLGVLTSLFVPSIGLDHFNGNAWQGIFRSKNCCAQFMLFFVTPAISFTFPSRAMNVLRYLLFVLAALLLVMSNAKTSWILGPAYVLLMVALAAIRRFRRKDGLFLISTGGVLFIAFACSVPFLLPFILSALGKDSNLTGRLPLWASAMVSILKRPLLGYGFQAFWQGLQGESLNVFMDTHFEISQAQNGILEIWLQLGLAGVTLVVVSLVAAFRNALTCFQHGPSDAVNWYVGLLALTLSYNVDETTLAIPHHIPWLLYLVACTGLAKEAARARAANRPQTPPLTQPAFPTAARRIA